nr:hypothetical protein BaRGS_024217 [Batillaria attramentaria]
MEQGTKDEEEEEEMQTDQEDQDQEEGKDEEEEEEEEDNPFRFIVKKNNDFMCIATEKLKFLDFLHFIAPGFSYAKYLAAYDVEETKGFFPYEAITSLEALRQTKLPPHSAFFSSLKNSNISDQDYAYCQRVWREKNMSTMRDFLVWYNNKDVVPFLEALDKQTKFYATLGLDMLKDAISLPTPVVYYDFGDVRKAASKLQAPWYIVTDTDDKVVLVTLTENGVKHLQVVLLKARELRVETSLCECKAGSAKCSHLVALMYSLAHFKKLGFKAVPPVISKTSKPQQ